MPVYYHPSVARSQTKIGAWNANRGGLGDLWPVPGNPLAELSWRR